MQCLSINWAENLIIWAIVLCVVVALVKLIIPRLLPAAIPAGLSWVPAALSYIVWGAILIFIVILAFDLIGCMTGVGGGFYHQLR